MLLCPVVFVSVSFHYKTRICNHLFQRAQYSLKKIGGIVAGGVAGACAFGPLGFIPGALGSVTGALCGGYLGQPGVPQIDGQLKRSAKDTESSMQHVVPTQLDSVSGSYTGSRQVKFILDATDSGIELPHFDTNREEPVLTVFDKYLGYRHWILKANPQNHHQLQVEIELTRETVDRGYVTDVQASSWAGKRCERDLQPDKPTCTCYTNTQSL